MERRLPQLLEVVSELGAHTRRDVAIDTTHAWHLMPHPLRLEHVTDAQFVEMSLS
jgi:hypothetical protein